MTRLLYNESNLTLSSLFTIMRVKIVVVAIVVLLSLFSFLFLQQFALAQENNNAATLSSTNTTAINSSSQSNNRNFTNLTNTNNSFLTYLNPTDGIKIQYPSYWRVSQTGLRDNTNIVAFYSPLENLSDTFSEHVIVSLTEYSQNMPLNDYSNLVNSVIRAPGVTVLDSKLISLTDGNPAQTIVFIPPPSGISSTLLKPEVMLIWTVKANKVYTISYNADSPNYSKYLPIVEKMVESFEITK